MLLNLTLIILFWVAANEWLGTYANRKNGNTYSSVNKKRRRK